MVATITGIGTLLFAAIGVVVQLKDALNTIWEVETTPESGVWRFVRSYILSRRGKICRSLPAGGDAAGRGLRRLVRGDLPAIRDDV
jgi:hypothetical protein